MEFIELAFRKWCNCFEKNSILQSEKITYRMEENIAEDATRD